jgi:hypothetical protein
MEGSAMIRIIPLFAFALAASAPALAAELVPVPQFDAIGLRGGGTVTIVPGAVERVSIVEGSSRFTHIYVEHGRSLRIDACNQHCPAHYQLRVEIQSPSVPTVAVTGGGEIRIASGFRPQRQLVAAVNGGGTIDARAMEASDVTAAVNGGGNLFVRAASRLTGAVHGGGSLRYWGNPQVTRAIQGGGWIGRGN